VVVAVDSQVLLMVESLLMLRRESRGREATLMVWSLCSEQAICCVA